MIELLDNLSLLKNPRLDLEQVQLAGVRYGAHASEIPEGRIEQVTLVPIVGRSEWSPDSGARFFDHNEKPLEIRKVIESAVASDGIIHFGGGRSAGLKDGRVIRFSIFGEGLKAFSYIKSYEMLLREFGSPDSFEQKTAYGDLMGYWNFYAASQKHIDWDSMNNRLALIVLGPLRARA